MKSLWLLPVAYIADVYGLLLIVPYIILFAAVIYFVRMRKPVPVRVPVTDTPSHIELAPVN